MTLMKSLLLGSAAGIVAVASAQAADLPTRKGAPAVEYVKVCSITVAGKPIVGFVIPGSDTCLHFTGYITGQVEGGNTKNGAVLNYNDGVQTITPRFLRNNFGYTTRLNFGADVVSNTAYGPLYGHLEMQFEDGNGFDNTGNTAYLNLAYITWAGITAGKAPSFFSFTGGGPGWANFFSPDQKGFNQPDLMAYTASFGGGFSATIAAQSPGSEGGSGGGTYFQDFGNGQNNILGNPFGVLPGEPANYTYNGENAPDVVGNINLTQGWGSAQVSGVGHYVNVTSLIDGAQERTWGWGVDAGVSFNLPQFGAGDEITVTGAYTEHAAWFSGIPDGMWGEERPGQRQRSADGHRRYLFQSEWHRTSHSGHLDDYRRKSPITSRRNSPDRSKAAYGEVNWKGTNSSSVVSDSTTWLAGVVAHWDPVKNLDFEFELLYQRANTDQPNGYNAVASGHPWVSLGDGFATRFEITRSW